MCCVIGPDRRVTIYKGFLQHHSRSADTTVAAVADNCRFDERASAPRWQRFDSVLSKVATNPGAIDWQDWAVTEQLHREQYCTVSSLSVPDTFLEINRRAWLDGLSPNQSVVRIETLSRPLHNSPLDVDGLRDLLRRADSGDADADRAVSSFFDDWNRRRDARPAFAAFYDEVKQEANDEDWPHSLRDRLGLGHYGYQDGAPLPVALMRYSLADVFSVQKHRELAVACAVPTVLDGGMHEFFFPAPLEHPYGATVHLSPDQTSDLTAEILHCRIDYKREHLWKLGRITRVRVQLTAAQLRNARDLHLRELREKCQRTDFGELFEGRT